MMKVALFIPCYVDQFYPQAAIATLELLQKCGCEVSYPVRQTCCGQPMANAGFAHLNHACNKHFIETFSNYDYVVAPSGSCVLHIRKHLFHDQYEGESKDIRNNIFELTEFMTDVLAIKSLNARFFFRVGMHQSCHGQRGLMLSKMSELQGAAFSKPLQLLNMVRGLELIDLSRVDECCGFGGTFCVTEEAVSVKMGRDRVADHISHGADYITGVDLSCLMHMEGILKRSASKVKVIHIAEILNADK